MREVPKALSNGVGWTDASADVRPRITRPLATTVDLSSTVPALVRLRQGVRRVKPIRYWSARASIGEIRAAR
jgi:hypothetical protein